MTDPVQVKPRDDRWMTSDDEYQWSPARNPYAIAVSQSHWAMTAVLQFATDAKTADGPAQQIYARQVFGQLRLLQRCAVMQGKKLARLGVARIHRDQLHDEIDAFEAAVPGAKSARDIREHFDEYACGDGRLQREAMDELGIGVFEAAAMFWGGGYDPLTEEVTEGPFVVALPRAVKASKRLHAAIYHAARAVDAGLGSA